jgi:hypothetical protein
MKESGKFYSYAHGSTRIHNTSVRTGLRARHQTSNTIESLEGQPCGLSVGEINRQVFRGAGCLTYQSLVLHPVQELEILGKANSCTQRKIIGDPRMQSKHLL